MVVGRWAVVVFAGNGGLRSSLFDSIRPDKMKLNGETLVRLKGSVELGEMYHY